MFLQINRLHILCFCLWQTALFFCCQQIFPIFYNFTPTRDCADPSFHWSEQRCRLTKEEQCNQLTSNCSHIIIEKPVFHSMVQDFDLFCGSKAYDATLVATIQFVGVLVGTIVYGHLGDHFGRRPVSFIGILIGVAFGVGSGFAPSWPVFAALRFVCGSSIACILVVFYTYILELILPNQRVFLRSFFNWGYARIVFTFVCFVCGFWRSAAMATALLAAPVLPFILFLLPESPKWYTTKGRYEEAERAMTRLRWISGEEEDEKIGTIDEAEESGEKWAEATRSDMEFCERVADDGEKLAETEGAIDSKVYTMKDLFAEKKLAIRTVILGSLWFSTSLSAFGSDLNSGNLAGSFYTTQFVSGLVTAFAKIFVFVLDTLWPSFDRRRLHQLPQVLMLLCYITIMILLIFVPDSDCDGDSWRDWTIIIINIIGVSLIEITWDACYLVAIECFPTKLRTIGVGTCSLLARIGALLAPQMAYLSNLAPAAPYGVVVGIGIFSLVVSLLFLPNTKGVDLSRVEEVFKEEQPGEQQ